MNKNENREFIPFDEVMDETFGKVGTPQRDDYDMNIELWIADQKIKEMNP